MVNSFLNKDHDELTSLRRSSLHNFRDGISESTSCRKNKIPLYSFAIPQFISLFLGNEDEALIYKFLLAQC